MNKNFSTETNYLNWLEHAKVIGTFIPVFLIRTTPRFLVMVQPIPTWRRRGRATPASTAALTYVSIYGKCGPWPHPRTSLVKKASRPASWGEMGWDSRGHHRHHHHRLHRAVSAAATDPGHSGKPLRGGRWTRLVDIVTLLFRTVGSCQKKKTAALTLARITCVAREGT